MNNLNRISEFHLINFLFYFCIFLYFFFKLRSLSLDFKSCNVSHLKYSPKEHLQSKTVPYQNESEYPLLILFISEVPVVLYAFLDAQAALQLMVLERWSEDEAPQFMTELFIMFLIINVPLGSIDT